MISQYAPKQLSPEEVKKVIEEKFADVIATKNKGCLLYTSGILKVTYISTGGK